MIYQLPCGRVVHLSVKQFLDMSDDDLKYIDGEAYGTSGSDPFKDFDRTDTKDTPCDHSPDMLSDGDEPSFETNIDKLLDDNPNI